MSVNCDYCNNKSEKVTGKEIYPHRKDLYEKIFYRCLLCDSYVGTHSGTDKPLGRLANAELRKAKQLAHKEFDYLWREKIMKRNDAYKWLAQQLCINQSECHIGMFDLVMTNKAVEAVQKYWDDQPWLIAVVPVIR